MIHTIFLVDSDSKVSPCHMLLLAITSLPCSWRMDIWGPIARIYALSQLNCNLCGHFTSPAVVNCLFLSLGTFNLPSPSPPTPMNHKVLLVLPPMCFFKSVSVSLIYPYHSSPASVIPSWTIKESS